MKLAEVSVTEFVRELSKDSPAPGGGSVAALGGALGAALCAMVSKLTFGKEKYRDAWEVMEQLKREADELAKGFLLLMDEDTLAYNEVVAAMKMPRGTEEQKSARKQALQDASKKAALVPLETLKASASLADLVQMAVAKGNPNCITDAGTAAQLARSAALGAAYNVRINLTSIDDKTFASKCIREVEEILTRVISIVEEVEKKVFKALTM
jgi:glutamate formiminotransferase/formiminotetrahydrofolate cyclodeaminase